MANHGDRGAEVAVSLASVGKQFSSDEQTVEALVDVSFEVLRGEVLCIVGRSGCGKSTLLRCIAGLEEVTHGDILIQLDHENHHGKGPVAFVFQDAALLPWRTVVGNVELALVAERLGRVERRSRAMKALELVGLSAFANVPPYRLSGGMQQRAAVARAIVTEASLLLMDEPFAAADFFTREQLRRELKSLAQRLGLTVIFVTHDLDEALDLGNRIVVLSSSPGTVLEVVNVSVPATSRSAGDQASGLFERDVVEIVPADRAEVRAHLECLLGGTGPSSMSYVEEREHGCGAMSPVKGGDLHAIKSDAE